MFEKMLCVLRLMFWIMQLIACAILVGLALSVTIGLPLYVLYLFPKYVLMAMWVVICHYLSLYIFYEKLLRQ